jgi:signal peptidase I
VNGVAVKEPYLNVPVNDPASELPFQVTVPKNSLWVMGDNRNDSRDSRYNRNGPTKGFVPMSDVVGRAIVISWPISHWTWLSDYGSDFAGVTKK